MDLVQLLKGIDPRPLLIKLAIALSLIGGVAYIAYEKGQASCRIEQAEDKAREVEVRYETLTKYIEVRVPEIKYIDRVNVEYRDRIVKVKETVYEQIEADARDSCSISESERMRWNELAGAAASGGDLR